MLRLEAEEASAVFHHWHHIIWVPNYRYKVMRGESRERVREIIQRDLEAHTL
ncbi:MAG: hypothetical protein COA85_12170 [Robiginitomaculum sp.]|nr:MAG: hypothetical protein COA85_12170 [Robiginitomaculum sp.]